MQIRAHLMPGEHIVWTAIATAMAFGTTVKSVEIDPYIELPESVIYLGLPEALKAVVRQYSITDRLPCRLRGDYFFMGAYATVKCPYSNGEHYVTAHAPTLEQVARIYGLIRFAKLVPILSEPNMPPVGGRTVKQAYLALREAIALAIDQWWTGLLLRGTGRF